jgi:tetratricopeptide (TPR) repeat protein
VRKSQRTDRALIKEDHPVPLDALLQSGINLHRASNYQAARFAYQKVLEQDGSNNAAIQLLILVELASGRFSHALELCDRSLQLDDQNANVHYHKASVLASLQRIEDSLLSFDSALFLDPHHIDALRDRALTRHEYGLHAEALSDFETLLELDPKNFEVQNFRGLALLELARIDDALSSFECSVEMRPEYIEGLHNYGNALILSKRYNEALAVFDKVIAIDHDFEPSLQRKGDALMHLNKLPQAINCFQAALRVHPLSAVTKNNLGTALHAQGQYDEAMHYFDAAICLDQEYPRAYWNKAFSLLLQGDYAEGWKLYEWRLRMEDAAKKFPSFDKPSWRGTEDISDKRLLIAVEQGLGDFIQFCRYVPLLLDRALEVILEVPKILAPLIETLHPDITLVIKGEGLPEFDVYCPLMSLPFVFGTTLESIPSNERYLQSDPKKVALWRERLSASARPRVGLVWSGAAGHDNDHNRSIALSDLVPVLGADYEWHSLQKEYRDADFEVLQQAQHIHQHQDDLHDFSDTAALMENLDFVITVDTSVAHLAGALGKEVWVLLPKVPDFRWLLDREDSPWYASAKLIRQDDQGEWSASISELNMKLHAAGEDYKP